MVDVPIPFIDRIDTLEAHERKGVIVELTRVCRIVNLRGVDYTALSAALDAIDVPIYGDKLEGAGYEALVVVDRNVKMVGEDPNYSDVTIIYKQPLDEEAAQSLDTPINSISDNSLGVGVIYGRMRCSLQQKPTNFYIERNEDGTLREGKFITVKHDFTNNFDKSDPNFGGKIDVQGGSINVQQPAKVFSFGGVLTIENPWVLADLLIASINKTMWQGESELTWMCTEVQYEVLTLGKYKFGFQFTNNQDTWLYTPIWTNPFNGKPHPNAVEGKDYYHIHYHREVDFNAVFGGFFENWNPEIG